MVEEQKHEINNVLSTAEHKPSRPLRFVIPRKWNMSGYPPGVQFDDEIDAKESNVNLRTADI